MTVMNYWKCKLNIELLFVSPGWTSASVGSIEPFIETGDEALSLTFGILSFKCVLPFES